MQPLLTLSANVTSASDSTVSCGHSYTYRAVAYNDAGDLPFSTSATVITHPCQPGSFNALLTSQTRADFSWTDASLTESGFRLERLIDSGTWATLAALPANTTSASDTSLACGHSYQYRVWTTSSVGDIRVNRAAR